MMKTEECSSYYFYCLIAHIRLEHACAVRQRGTGNNAFISNHHGCPSIEKTLSRLLIPILMRPLR